MSIAAKQQQIVDDLNSLPNEQMVINEHIVSLGRRIPKPLEDIRTPENLIRGCQAEIWLDATFDEGKLHYHVDSDSLITKGIVYLFLLAYNDETPEAILTADRTFLDNTPVRQHLTATRANAITLVATQMKQRALQFASQA